MNNEDEQRIIDNIDELIETLKEMKKTFDSIDKRLKAIGTELGYMNN